MSERRRGSRATSEGEHVRVELVDAPSTEPLPIEEVRKANAPYFEALAGIVGPVLAEKAFEEFIADIEESRIAAAQDGGDDHIIRVTLQS